MNGRVEISSGHVRDVEVPDRDSVVQMEPPWSESYEISSTEVEGMVMGI